MPISQSSSTIARPLTGRATLRLVAFVALAILVVPAVSSGVAIAATNTNGTTNDPTLTVQSVALNGSAITGYQTVLYSSGGVQLAEGFTPTTFTTTSGVTYSVLAESYGSCNFAQWGDGVTSNPRTFTATSSSTTLTAEYNCSTTPPAGSSVTVNSENQLGAAITGYYTELLTSTGGVVSSGFTPQTFTTTAGVGYQVAAASYGSCTFTNWSNGATSDPMSFTATSSGLTFTAVYDCSGVSGQTSSVSVSTVDQYGAPITGYYTSLFSSSGSVISSGFSPATFNTTAGQSYSISVSNYGSCSFTGWSTGATSNPLTFTATSSALSLTAEYNCTSGTTSTVIVNSVNQDGTNLPGASVTLLQSGQVQASGTTSATFNTIVGFTYQLKTTSTFDGCTFSNWSVNDNNSAASFVATSSPPTLNAVFDCNNGGATTITVYAHRIPAGYWAPCFATVCAAGTGPGASMFFALYLKNGTLVSTGFSDENGLQFTGLTPGVTYMVLAENCDLCHGSTHDVLFDHWGNGTTTDPIYVTAGAVLDAWYTCTNGCGGGV